VVQLLWNEFIWGVTGLLFMCVALTAGCTEGYEPIDGQNPPDPGLWTHTKVGEVWTDEAGEPIPAPDDLEDLEWLANMSHYGQDGLYEGRHASGTFGVGNGIVFGLLGPDSPWNTLTNGIGPGYQRDAGFFGDSAVVVVDGGEEMEVEEERVQRPRGTAVVRTLTRSGDVSWSTTDLAVVAEPVNDFETVSIRV
jgi:hypothetical protein